MTNYIFIDPCTGQNCSGHGTCIVDASDATDGYSCACNRAYSGDNCEIGKFQRISSQE